MKNNGGVSGHAFQANLHQRRFVLLQQGRRDRLGIGVVVDFETTFPSRRRGLFSGKSTPGKLYQRRAVGDNSVGYTVGKPFNRNRVFRSPLTRFDQTMEGAIRIDGINPDFHSATIGLCETHSTADTPLRRGASSA